MADSDFATTILTSKSPEDVANFLPHSLTLSSTLIEKNLVSWFSNYANVLARYNHDLNQLVSDGRNFFPGTDAEFGAVDKIWNCVASSVMSQISVNDLLIRAIRADILAPFTAAFKTDFKYPELIVNSTELVEMLRHLDDPNGAYNWNVKAPAILSNFENYKRYEKDLLFSGFLSYLNTYNAKTSGVLSKNENAVNYILKEFNVETEMKKYTEYMVLAKAPQAAVLPPPPPPSEKPHGRHHLPRASVTSSSAHSILSGDHKKKSKLRSKMGSILGRKKKTSALTSSETIPEDHSVSSVPSRQHTTASIADTRTSVYGSSNNNINTKQTHQPENPRGLGAVVGAVAGAAAVGTAAGAAALSGSLQEPKGPKFSGFQQGMSSRPLQPSIPGSNQPVSPEKALPDPQLTLPEQSPAKNSSGLSRPDDDEANIVKYSSSDDDSDVPTDVQGNRISMLRAHNLDLPPKLDTDSDFRSRNTSSGKYSFEYGDEEKSISAKQTPKSTVAPAFPDFGAPPDDDTITQEEAPIPGQFPTSETEPVAETELAAQTSPVVNSARPAPPPPPSRKVHNPVNEASQKKRDASSLTFLNLHSARESYIQPHNTGGRASLISQTTGNSIFKQNDYFKHFASADDLIKEGLNTSVAEIINVSFKSGDAIKAQALGEIAFNYNSSATPQGLEVNIPTKFSRFLLNDQIMQQTGDGQFLLNTAQIQSKTLGGVKYMLDLKPTQIPVIVKQVWKFESHQASLIIKLSLNPAYDRPIELENFALSASLDTSVTSTAASSKPEGSFNKEANRITWRYSTPLVLSPQSPEEKLIARISTNGQGKESPLGVQVKFTISNPPVPFAQLFDGQGAAIPSVRSLSTGNYSSHI